MNRWSPYFLSILRIIAAFVYGVHGTQKLFGFPAPFPMPHLPPLFLAGGTIETFGGLLLLLGLFTRPVAFILSGEMAVAYFNFHAPQGFWPLLNEGEGAVLYCFMFLYFASTGGGPWSFDRWLRKTFTNRHSFEKPGTSRLSGIVGQTVEARPVCPQFPSVRTRVAD